MPVERDRWYAAPPDEVFEHLAGPDGLAGWAGGRAVVVDEVVDGQRIVFTWDGDGDDPPSRVEIRLEPEHDGTRVVVVERAMEPVPSVPVGFQPRALARA